MKVDRKASSLDRHPNFYKKVEDEEMEDVDEEDCPPWVSK
jgi:hypothetical protein